MAKMETTPANRGGWLAGAGAYAMESKESPKIPFTQAFRSVLHAQAVALTDIQNLRDQSVLNPASSEVQRLEASEELGGLVTI